MRPSALLVLIQIVSILTFVRIIVLFLSTLDHGAAFAPLWHHRSHVHRFSAREDSSEPQLSNNIEEARHRFEELMRDETVSQLYGEESLANNMNDDVLTTVGRHRRMVEMALLDSLRDSNDALDEIMHFWITERDEDSASQIIAMEKHCSSGLENEEEQLRRMMEQYPSWAEPVLRLTTLLFFKGRTDESYKMALRVVQLKPWHIEAPHLLVMICLRNKDMKQALYWARRSLPRMTESVMAGDNERFLRRRHAWVESSLAEAKKQLAKAEHLLDQSWQRLELSVDASQWQ
jgi:hypothetical protein